MVAGFGIGVAGAGMKVRDDLLHSRSIGMLEGIDADGAQA